MNYLPFAGYWFYGGTDAGETASFFASWGLLASAPVTGAMKVAVMIYYKFMRD